MRNLTPEPRAGAGEDKPIGPRKGRKGGIASKKGNLRHGTREEGGTVRETPGARPPCFACWTRRDQTKTVVQLRRRTTWKANTGTLVRGKR